MLKQLRQIFNTSTGNDTPLENGYDLRGYTIERLLHRGGMSWVYKAWDPKGKPVLIKEFFPHKSVIRMPDTSISVLDERTQYFKEAFRRFHEEGRYMGMFRGASFCRVRSFFRYNNTGYLVCELERGRTLAGYIKIKRHAYPEFKTVLSLTKDICDGLQKMHNEHVLHMDIHPANIHLTLHRKAILLDFGAARHIAEPILNGARFYTPGFSAPEIKTTNVWGPWCDIYSFGACLKASGFLKPECIYPDNFKTMITKCLIEDYKQRPQSFDDPVFDCLTD